MPPVRSRSTSPSKQTVTDNLVLSYPGKERSQQMLARGVPGFDLIPRRADVDLADVLVKIEHSGSENTPGKIISTGKQYKSLQAILDNPLHGSYVVGISSFPSDQRAKHVAQLIMCRAIDAWYKHHKAGRTLPLWHRVYGSTRDSLRDRPLQEIPSMLILSNINTNSTGMKLEIVRDLLEKFSDIPRIVVTGGSPACELFTNRLFYPLRSSIHLGPSGMVKEIS